MILERPVEFASKEWTWLLRLWQSCSMHCAPQVRRTKSLTGSRPPTIDHWRIGQFIGQACGHPGCGAMELVASAYAGLGSAPARKIGRASCRERVCQYV